MVDRTADYQLIICDFVDWYMEARQTGSTRPNLNLKQLIFTFCLTFFFDFFFLCAAGHTESQILFFANKGLKMQETLIWLFPQKTGEIVSPTLILVMHNLNIELLFGEQVLQLGGPFQSFIQSVMWQGVWSCLAPGR